MKALRRFLLRVFTVEPRRTPREVRRRLQRYEQERKCREIAYAAAWQRKWDKAAAEKRDAEARQRRSTYTVVPR